MQKINYLGDYEHTITVNGNRRVIGTGHTRQEAYRNALDGAAWLMPSVAVVFQLERESMRDNRIQHNSVIDDDKGHCLIHKTKARILAILGRYGNGNY